MTTPLPDRHPPADDAPEASSGFLRYAVGRPLMVITWGVALWGTFVGLRLGWIAMTRGAMEASILFGDPVVMVPVLVAVVAWMLLVFAVRAAADRR